MKITGAHGPHPNPPTGRAREAAPPAPPIEPADGTDVSETPEAPETKPHGLVRSSADSHRSPVAALRVWLNHPELRSQLEVPDLKTTIHPGQGFAKAVAAYQAATPVPDSTIPAVESPVNPTLDPPADPEDFIPDSSENATDVENG